MWGCADSDQVHGLVEGFFAAGRLLWSRPAAFWMPARINLLFDPGTVWTYPPREYILWVGALHPGAGPSRHTGDNQRQDHRRSC